MYAYVLIILVCTCPVLYVISVFWLCVDFCAMARAKLGHASHMMSPALQRDRKRERGRMKEEGVEMMEKCGDKWTRKQMM